MSNFHLIAGKPNKDDVLACHLSTFRGKYIFGSIYVLLVCLICCCGSAYAGNYLTGRVLKVIDGDSFVLKTENSSYEIRLWGIDCPEYRQKFSAGARSITRRYLEGKEVQVRVKYRDKYDRYVGVAMTGNTNINERLVAEGAAWVYTRYCRDAVCTEWKSLERDARNAGIGLWKQQSPIAPWLWRRKNS